MKNEKRSTRNEIGKTKGFSLCHFPSCHSTVRWKERGVSHNTLRCSNIPLSINFFDDYSCVLESLKVLQSKQRKFKSFLKNIAIFIGKSTDLAALFPL